MSHYRFEVPAQRPRKDFSDVVEYRYAHKIHFLSNTQKIRN